MSATVTPLRPKQENQKPARTVSKASGAAGVHPRQPGRRAAGRDAQGRAAQLLQRRARRYLRRDVRYLQPARAGRLSAALRCADADHYDPVLPVEWLATEFHWPHAAHYAEVIFDLAQRRLLINAAADQAQGGYTLPGEQALAEAQSRLQDIAERQARGEDGRIGTAITEMQTEEREASDAAEHGVCLAIRRHRLL